MRLSGEAFQALRKAIHELCGLVIGEDKRYLITSRLEPVLRQHALPSYDALAAALGGANSMPLRDQVVESITTKETSFNRDGHPFEELRRSIVPALAGRLRERRASTRLADPGARIWCSAVATGQEAYSVAMAVADFLASRPGLGLTLDDFPILATDVSQASLAIAREGRYTAADVARGVPPAQRDRYFRPMGDAWAIDDRLRRAIEFRRLNLNHPLPSLGTFDLVLCRNVLIYFDEGHRRRLCQGLHRALIPGGFLMIGAAESLFGITDTFTPVRMGGTIVHIRS
ncbi:Chemotaxis protein methyltransferase Cher2 [Aquisphaera giovannonii]|uniref:protein-glutamate O-methyltransferase n=1 Tax=Aquisphaera giovannonii TaxID=406548 RepID=A0A5B9VWZ9_9BACT|nr:protein-glutamate O-methyltransferase CheR [Aquisphaera giovannonii]QEH32477.1 Chemotaxis protein methyltransferase Cher2 [Aquisphaera giovannonii]